jgi:MarR family transcriptional regulator, negative regulator of the multidrug operon emrRAB
MPHTSSREANLLGALSVAVADRIRAGAETVAENGGGAPAALAALTTFLDGCSIDELSAVLGLSHSATVRMVDRLEARALVSRRAASDRRAVAVQLKPAGRAVGSAILAARAEAVEELLVGLPAVERDMLTELMERLLEALASTGAHRGHICRLCDPDACGHWVGRCPVTEAGRRMAAAGG